MGTKASAASRHLASQQVAGANQDRFRRAGRATTTAPAVESLQERVVSRAPADEARSKPVKRGRRVRQTVPLQDRLSQQVRDDRD